LDLHGSTKKRETDPDGSKDENVFDIQQGVSVFLGFGGPNNDQEIQHRDLFGVRETQTGEGKYQWLSANTIFSAEFQKLLPRSPFYMLVPRDESLVIEYEAGPSLPELMPINVLGFQTHRDGFAIAMDENSITDRIADLRNDDKPTEKLRQKYGLRDNRDWHLEDAREAVHCDDDWREKIILCAYRPFDDRFCYFSNVAMDYPRRELLDHVAWKSNLALLASRQQNTLGFRHAWVAIAPPNDCVVSNATREANYVYPLLVYPLPGLETEVRPNFRAVDVSRFFRLLDLEYNEHITDQRFEVSHVNGDRRVGNGDRRVGQLKSLADRGRGDLDSTFGPRDLFDYIYAILHSPEYRRRYSVFLKSDFPRIPLPTGCDVFIELVAIGRQLVALHLLDEAEASVLKQPNIRLAGSGGTEVENGYPKYENGRVFANPNRWFEDVPQNVWDFEVGSFQLCNKWLKDRAARGGRNPRSGRVLTDQDIRHYAQIVTAIGKTIRLMEKIDRTIYKHGGWPDAFYVPPPPPPTIEEIVRADEGQDLEYKSTFQWSLTEERKDGEVRKACLKTVAAFLNSGGGMLVIGVSDDRKILGLEADLALTRNEKEWFQQTIVNHLSRTIGAEFAPSYEIRFSDASDGKEVCIIEVTEKGPSPAFLEASGDSSEFYVRTSNKTERLTDRTMYDYIKAHW